MFSKSIPTLVLLFISTTFFSQTNTVSEKFTAHNKGKFYFFWGGNREEFTTSTIHFTGNNYDFTVYDATAHDKPKGWNVDYVNPGRMTIPQTNFRMGYFFNDHYNISVGLDHMKYVMTQDQIATVSGYVNLPSSEIGSLYNGTYNYMPVDFGANNTDYDTVNPFLTFEHTDGLNYVNTEISRVDDFSKLFGIKNTDKFQVNLTEGFGAGLLYPKTNAKVLGYTRHDDFHVSGYGISAKVGINLTFFKYFFIQGELKDGYINMNDIRTTASTADKASQHFLFFERVVSFGGIFKI